MVVYAGIAIFVAPGLLDDAVPAGQRAAERGSVRTAMLAVLAGAIATVGAVYTHRNYLLSRRGQLTERFTRAVDQLEKEKSLDVRLGGIYALERLAHESPEEHGPVIEILTAYVRGRSKARSKDEPGLDIQAVMTVLRRRNRDHEDESSLRLDLRGSNLRGLDLKEAQLERAVLDNADLSGALASDAHLQRASLREALLFGTDLEDADLRQALLSDADLRKASLVKADLRDALVGLALFQEANLAGADLREATINQAALKGARYGRVVARSLETLEDKVLAQTEWPSHIDPTDAEAIESDEIRYVPVRTARSYK